MVNVEQKLDWGRSTTTFSGLKKVEERRVHSEGINEICPKRMITLHQHQYDNEEYTILTEGLKVIVIPSEEAKKLKNEEVLKLLKEQKSLSVGEKIVCPKRYAHALYNSSNNIGRFEFCKYY